MRVERADQSPDRSLDGHPRVNGVGGAGLDQAQQLVVGPQLVARLVREGGAATAEEAPGEAPGDDKSEPPQDRSVPHPSLLCDSA